MHLLHRSIQFEWYVTQCIVVRIMCCVYHVMCVSCDVCVCTPVPRLRAVTLLNLCDKVASSVAKCVYKISMAMLEGCHMQHHPIIVHTHTHTCTHARTHTRTHTHTHRTKNQLAFCAYQTTTRVTKLMEKNGRSLTHSYWTRET